MIDVAALARQVETAVDTVVRKQLEVGIDIGHDGEQPRVAFHTEVARRMHGFGGGWVRPVRRDSTECPDCAATGRARQQRTARPPQPPQAVAEVEYPDVHEAEQACDLCLRCTEGQPPPCAERFRTAASPGIIATAMGNAYDDSHER